MIYSIGYQAVTLDELLRIMGEKGIGLLVDVRSVPYSRIPEKYEFNKNRLRARLGGAYVWKGDIYGGKHRPAKEQCIKDIIEMNRNNNIILMCMEYHPCDCHRYFDIGKRLLNKGIEVHHFVVHTVDGYRTGIDEYTTRELKEVCGARRKARKKSRP